MINVTLSELQICNIMTSMGLEPVDAASFLKTALECGGRADELPDWAKEALLQQVVAEILPAWPTFDDPA